jgi:hypothetical protein
MFYRPLFYQQTTAVAKQLLNTQTDTGATTALQQRNDVFCAVRAETS